MPWYLSNAPLFKKISLSGRRDVQPGCGSLKSFYLSLIYHMSIDFVKFFVHVGAKMLGPFK